MKEKTYVEDVNRSIYDIRNEYGRDCYLCTPQHADECEMVRGSDRYQKYV